MENLYFSIQLDTARSYQADLETILKIREDQIEKILLRARRFVEGVVKEFYLKNERESMIEQLMKAFDDD